jgi:formate C-acetyltransferase|tara:strand:- start:508 stop:2778 length:2271 start_codon:yes stop_codon:yes gene_type:complete
MQATEGEPIVTRRAKVFAAIVREMPIDIYPDELIVGCFSGKPRCWNVSPSEGPQLEKTLSSANPRKGATRLKGIFKADHWDATTLTDDEKRELTEDLIPYWKGEGNYEQTMAGRNYLDIKDRRSQHVGHNCVDYRKVLEKGFLGIKKDAEDRLARIDLGNPEDAGKVPFLEGVILDMASAAELGNRFAVRARELAAIEVDASRKTELLGIAEVCQQVPAHPARTLHEAVQSYFFTWILLFWEQPIVSAVSPGAADQYLYPYYDSDVREGRITTDSAQELLDCYILKLNQIPNESLSTHLSVGGLKANGNDATNKLSHMFIEAMMHTRLMAPIFSVQVHSKAPDDLLIKASQLCSLGTGHPQFVNQDVAVAQTLARGCMGGPAITLADARSATPIGCVELAIPAKDAGWTGGAGLINFAACMEYVLSNGVRRSDSRQIGCETGDPREFTSFDEVVEAYRKQVAWQLHNGKRIVDVQERSMAEIAPTVYESALLDDCIEKGICRELGGAHHNSSNQILPIGPIDAADSMTAIRKLVFEDKKITMSELCDALDNDFEGYEQLRRMLLDAPKYGNDDDYADEQAALVNHVVASEGLKIGKNIRGGDGGIVGGSAWWLFATIGAILGALPSGRRGGAPLNDAHSPCSGFDVKGPTAVLKSMGKIDNKELMGGVLLNLRLDPGVFKQEDGIKRLVGLIRAFVDQQILHVQFNIVSSDTLKAAQEDPESHRDLLVKVAGYSAFFVQLIKPSQDAIIARTEHGL